MRKLPESGRTLGGHGFCLVSHGLLGSLPLGHVGVSFQTEATLILRAAGFPDHPHVYRGRT